MIMKNIIDIACKSAIRWPFHSLILASILASMAYYAILSLAAPMLDTISKIAYYRPSQSSAWIPINSSYPILGNSITNSTSNYVLAPVQYTHSTQPSLTDSTFPELPRIDGIRQVDDTLYLFVKESELPSWVSSAHKTLVPSKSGHQIWRLRSTNGLSSWIKWNASQISQLMSNAEHFDIAVVTIGYLAMWFTFTSLFVSMKKLGSHFWLATAIIIVSTVAFMFAFVISTFFGVHVSLVTLSEGLPFLVVTVGFESKILYTRLVLKESVRTPTETSESLVPRVLKSHFLDIFRDYAIEMLALFGGVLTCVNELWQFCFLSLWILFCDALLTTVLYSAVLAIKVEVFRIKHNRNIKQALEDDGVSGDVARSVSENSTLSAHVGRNAPRESYLVWFKTLWVIAFILMNVFQISGFSFTLTSSPVSLTSIAEKVSSLPEEEQWMSALNYLTSGIPGPIKVSKLSKIVFEPALHHMKYEKGLAHFMESWTHRLSDPVISRILLIFFIVSMIFNGYLFGVARDHTFNVVERVVQVEKHVPVVIEKCLDGDKTTSESDAIGQDIDDKEIEVKGAVPSLRKSRSIEECAAILKAGMPRALTNEELVRLGVEGQLPLYALEKQLADTTRAVVIRRAIVSRLSATQTLERSKLPFKHYNYDIVQGACCENVIGYMPLPVGIAGPVIVDGTPYYLPMATTEGCLVASTMRGCKAMNAGGGVTTVLTNDGMTRGPCVSFDSLVRAGAAKMWLDSAEGQASMRSAFESTSRFAKLKGIKTALAGSLLFMRFTTTTGDAMGMNMISKGVERALSHMTKNCGFEDMRVVSVSGNFCTDKKPAAVNWIEGRGKSVVAESIVPESVVRTILKSEVDALVELNTSKNLVGSAMAGSVGGFNAHASNIVTAIFLATGQDPAQNVESSNCITLMSNVNGDLKISVSMPSIEVGTIGGGTILEPQGAMLDLLGIRGPHPSEPGANARKLARIVAAGVLAAELSLCAALAAGHLVQSHMAHNRAKAVSPAIAAPDQESSRVDLDRLRDGSRICIKS